MCSNKNYFEECDKSKIFKQPFQNLKQTIPIGGKDLDLLLEMVVELLEG